MYDELSYMDFIDRYCKKIGVIDMEKEKVEEYLKEKEQQMNECQHLFLKIKEGQEYSGFHSSDNENKPCVVTCVKCGLTNRFMEMDEVAIEVEKMFMMYNPYYQKYIKANDSVFKQQFHNAWRRCGKSFDDSVFNLISDEVLNVNRPMLLYSIAKQIKPDADDTEIFDTMKTLYEIETPEERAKLNNIEQAQELIARYKNRKVLQKNNQII